MQVIEWAKYHHANPDQPSEEKKDEKKTDDIIPWDKEFCDVDQPTLFELILAANYLDIKPLLDLTCKTVANMIKGKTPEVCALPLLCPFCVRLTATIPVSLCVDKNRKFARHLGSSTFAHSLDVPDMN